MKIKVILAATCSLLLSAASGRGLDKDDLYGTWRLVGYVREAKTGEKSDFFGKDPHGILNYGRDGRMYAMIVKDERPKPIDPSKPTDAELANLFKTMVAYGGTFELVDKKVIHRVDISWNGSWSGTEQSRDIKLDGGKLYITNVQPDFISYLVWERVK
ncbi:MAG: lipocalin-like domain-containing protein [Acidobacteriota bacterium]|nr:lipocalin-like domain-containing protein [Acidobacteriota bacterium]